MAARRTVERESVPAVMYYIMARPAPWMTTGLSVAHLFGNFSTPRKLVCAPTRCPRCFGDTTRSSHGVGKNS
jgi:hypothetical protein